MSKWISVDDRLPIFQNDCGYVLVACEGGNVDRSFFNMNRKHLSELKSSGSYSRKVHGKSSGYFEASHRYGYKITHWMPLPEPPK